MRKIGSSPFTSARRVHRIWMIPLLLVSSALGSCGSDETGGVIIPGPPPTITSLSDSVLAPGDILIIQGKNFASDVTRNRVTFNNSLASVIPDSAAGDFLRVVVPPFANSGPMRVTTSGLTSAPRTVEITRGVGDVWVIGGGSSYSFKLPGPLGTYLLVPHSASGGPVASFLYEVTPDTTSVYPVSSGRRSRDRGTTSLAIEFEQHIRRQAIEEIRRKARASRRLKRAAPALTPPDTTAFLVLGCTTCPTDDPANYNTITAALRYQGSTALIYADVNQPTGSFNQADYDAFGLQFDTKIFPGDTMYFGPPTDIDGNGWVIILFTPRVNELTPPGTAQTGGFISGFFLPNDLAPNSFPTTSNATEIFYAMVPDPFDEFGNTFPKSVVAGVIPGTLAHEFEHMISFGYRFVTLGGFAPLQPTWLEEGMAHMAEDLNNFDADNIARANLYLADPGGVSLMDSDTLEQRGGIFLFLRYLGDQHGDGIYKSILQSECIGRCGVENTTGLNFFASAADYLAALYLSDRGITSEARYNFSAFDIQNDFAPLAVSARGVGAGAFNGDVRNAAGDFYEMSGLEAPATEFQVSAGGEIRMIVVRIQ